MKRVCSILLALSLTLTLLVGCVNREEDQSSSSSSSSPSSSTTPSLPPEEPSSSVPEESSLPPSAPPVFSPTMEADLSALADLSTAAVKWGPTNYIADDDNRPVACVDLQEKYGKYDSFFIAPNSERVYLTFDEGYENGYTSNILDILKEKQVSAVFFVTLSYAKANPELIQRMIDEGHIVGNHSCNHTNFSTIPVEEAYEEILRRLMGA